MNPAFDFHTLNFTTDPVLARSKFGDIINSTNPDLRPFRSHGGKLIHYVGWADSAIAPMNSVNYYNAVGDVLRGAARHDRDGGPLEEIQEFYRLFMVPGMAHCGGGDGANAFGNGVDAPVIDAAHDLLVALDRWVEQGVAPAEIIGTHYVNNTPASGVQYQRPLCPFPEVARFNGGDPNSAASFTCVKDDRDHDPRDQSAARDDD